jgi:hypothetical protein
MCGGRRRHLGHGCCMSARTRSCSSPAPTPRDLLGDAGHRQGLAPGVELIRAMGAERVALADPAQPPLDRSNARDGAGGNPVKRHPGRNRLLDHHAPTSGLVAKRMATGT